MRIRLSSEARAFLGRLPSGEVERVWAIVTGAVTDEPVEGVQVHYERGLVVSADQLFEVWVEERDDFWAVLVVRFSNGAVREAFDDQQW